MMLAANGKTVLVTGGSGFIGSWVAIQLLERGYSVHATLRSLGREWEVRAAIAGKVEAGDRLRLYAANLLEDSGWDAAVEGCEALIHVASPMPAGEYKKTDVIRPAREGTLRVLEAARRAGVRRVVLTSSLQAALPPAGYMGPPTEESLWTDLTSNSTSDYTKAKTLAEQDAWTWMREQGAAMTLTSILAGMVQGPVLGSDFSPSVELITRMFTGKLPRFPRIGFSTVDVRDLANLHIQAMESHEAAGERILGTGDFLWLSQIAHLLREHFGERARKVPTKAMPDAVIRLLAFVNSDARFFAPRLGERLEFSAAKAAQLFGWYSRPATETIVDTAESLFRNGVL